VYFRLDYVELPSEVQREETQDCEEGILKYSLPAMCMMYKCL